MKTRLTKSEMEIMEVLWDAGKALTTSEIVQRSKEKEKEWKRQFCPSAYKKFNGQRCYQSRGI